MNKLKKLFKLHVLPISVMLVMFLISCEARGESECSKWWDLSSEQRYRLQWAYSYGEQYDLGWTMSAIAWHESNAGQYKINTKSNDYGVFHWYEFGQGESNHNYYWYEEPSKAMSR